jgi:hypothetical protein
MSATPSAPQKPRGLPAPRLPEGHHLSHTWLDAENRLVIGDPERKIPINSTTLRPAGMLWLCPAGDCATGEWTFGDGTRPKNGFCPAHGVPLVAQSVDERESDPVAGAKLRLRAKVAQVLEQRRDLAIKAATGKALAAHQAALQAGQRTVEDYTAHAPTLGVAAATVLGAVAAAELGDPLMVASIATTYAVAGAVIAYAAAYLFSRERARQRKQRFAPGARAERAAMSSAQTVGGAVMASGLFTAADAAVAGSGHGLADGGIPGALMLGAGILLAWLFGSRHWTKLSDERARLRELAAEKARQAAQEAAAEVQTLLTPEPAREPEPEFDENDPLQVGERMARQWEQISRLADTPIRFSVMPRTRILPELTRAVMAPTPSGEQKRIGWEFIVEGDPGVLVPPPGMPSPVIHARVWLAAMMRRDPISVALVERPEGDINRAVLLLTDGAPLGSPVPYLGAAGIQRLSNGTIMGHAGRDITGKDHFSPLYIPGQTFGGLIIGTSGGGKSQSVRVRRLLNNLYAGIFSTLYDPKNFVDYSEFAGVIPMGCTQEHRDVILRSLYAEMIRRQQMLSRLVGKDRFDRIRPVEGAWKVERDGPPILSIWDEFHLEATDVQYVGAVTTLVRLQRATASGVLVASQGGGLKDMGDSVFRFILGSTGMEIYRMPMSQARLAGYSGDFDPIHLPKLPGMVLEQVGEGGPVVPMRTAFVTREDEDGSIYDHLYAPDGTQILFAPKLPEATLEVFEREGLMDLWRMGMGEGGLARLQADGDDPALPPPGALEAGNPTATPGKARKKPIEGRDMILAILARGTIGTFSEILNHPMWLQDPGRTGTPAASTITRPVRELENDGLLHNPERDDVWRVLTAKGQPFAEKALMAFEIATGQRAVDAGGSAAPADETVADKERRIDREREEERVMASDVDQAAQS